MVSDDDTTNNETWASDERRQEQNGHLAVCPAYPPGHEPRRRACLAFVCLVCRPLRFGDLGVISLRDFRRIERHAAGRFDPAGQPWFRRPPRVLPRRHPLIFREKAKLTTCPLLSGIANVNAARPSGWERAVVDGVAGTTEATQHPRLPMRCRAVPSWFLPASIFTDGLCSARCR